MCDHIKKELEEEFSCPDFDDSQEYKDYCETLEKETYKDNPKPAHCPDCGTYICPQCNAELKYSGGYVGEEILYCETHGIIWEDHQDAIRRVI